MDILYFAWVREKIGTGAEQVELPPGVSTVAALVEHLASRSPGHAAAFANRASIRAAVNQDFASLETPVSAKDEVAFFPPVTGG
jgi:molybdopterin converting factor subunit 1